MMEPRDLIDLYRKHDALLHGHFRLSSGMHSDLYFQSALALAIPSVATELGRALGSAFDPHDVDVVVGPALGAIVIAQEIARHLNCQAFFAERVDDKFVLRRGFKLEPGMKVLVVEDVVTTARSILDVGALVNESGADLMDYACIIDRRADGVQPGLELLSLVQIQPAIWKPEDCPLCSGGEPLTVPGSRKLKT